jgi:hypothetical protein
MQCHRQVQGGVGDTDELGNVAKLKLDASRRVDTNTMPLCTRMELYELTRGTNVPHRSPRQLHFTICIYCWV